ncbi:MAG TPA: hypothetical protein VF765_10355 [Polyangiaceae bacterium]
MIHDDARRWLATAALGCGCIVLAACSQGDKFVFNEAEFVHQGQMLMPAISGCQLITLPGTSHVDDPGPHIGDFNTTEGADGDAYVVKVYSDTELLTQRSYSESTLAAGTVDEFSVTTHSGAVYTLRFWGGHVCTVVGLDASAE